MIISIVEQLVAQLDVPNGAGNIKFDFNHGASHWQNLLNDEYDFEEFQGVVFFGSTNYNRVSIN